MNVALILFVGGGVLVALIYFWSRLRPESEYIDEVEQVLRDVPMASEGDAVLVSREHGQLVYANPSARTWIGMNGGDPNLEQIANLAQPADNFFELFAREGQSSFQLGRRWVEASSHRIPTGSEMRTVVVMRELKPGTQSSGVLDLSRAMTIINQIGESVDVSSGIEPTLQSILSIIRGAMNFDAGEINLYDAQTRMLTPRGWVGDASYLVALSEAGGAYERGESITGWIAHYREGLLLATEQDVKAINPKVSNIPYKSIVGVPLLLGERLLGTIEIAALKTGIFDKSDLALMQAISKPVAVAIYNADIYAEQVKRVEDLTNIQQIVERATGLEEGQSHSESVLVYDALNRRISELMDTEMSGVFLYSAERNGLVPALPFYGLPDALMRSVLILLPPDSPQRDIWQNQPYWISNNVNDEPLAEALGLKSLIDVAGIRNTAWMPMKIGNERIGVLTASNKRESGFTPRDIRNLEVLASQAAIIVQNLRLADREQRLDAELAGLQEMTYAIGALDHEGEFYAEITERIARLMNVEMCGLLLFDEPNSRLVSRLPFYGVDDELVKYYHINIGEGTAIQEIWESEDYWYSNRVEADTLVFATGLDQLAEAIGVKKTMIAVLSTGGRKLGAVQVSNKHNEANFDESDGRLLTIFATQAATMIENARLFIEVQKSSEEAQQLRRIAEMAGSIVTSDAGLADLLGEIAKLMQSPVVYISTFDPSGSLVTNPNWVYGTELNEPVVYDIYSENFEHSPSMSKRTFFSNDLLSSEVLPAYRETAERYGLKNAILVPLVVGDRSLGEMGVSNRDGDYTKEDAERLTAIAAQITSALERLLLYQATGENLNRRLKELDAVSRISNELTATLDFEQILNAIRKEALNATSASGSSVALLKPNKQWLRPDKPEMDRRIGNARIMTDLADIEMEAIFKGAETVRIRNYTEEKMVASPPESRSAAAVAIVYSDQIVGVLHLWHTEPNKFDEQASAFLLTLATKAALGYGNAIRFQEQQDRSERLGRRVEQLNRIFELGQMLHTDLDPDDMLEAVAYSIQQSVGFDNVLVLLADEFSGVLRRVTQAGLPLDFVREKADEVIDLDVMDEVLRDEYRTSETFFFPVEKVKDWYVPELEAISMAYEGRRTLNAQGDDQWHDGDLLLVSLTGSGGERLGLIALDRPYSNERPDRPTIELLEIFTHQAATTLENTQLYQSSLQNAQQEALLNQILEAISSTLNLDEIVQSIGRNMRGQIPFNRIIVALVDANENGFDVLRLEEKDGDNLEFTRERRVTLENTALGRTYNERREYRYYADEPDDANYTGQYDDLRRWRADGENIGIVMPLITGGSCYGAIHIGSNTERTEEFTRHDQVLRRMTQLFVGGVQNTRLFNQAVELQVLNRSVVESIQQGIVVLDQSGRIISINSFMHRYGWEESAVGKDVFAYSPELADLIGDDVREVLNSGEPRERINQSTGGNDESASLVRNFYIYPLESERVVRGAVMLVEDVTERALLEQAMEARANQLAALTEVSSRITSSLERVDVIVLALEEMKWLLHYDTMSLWRRNGSFMALEGSAGVNAIHSDENVRIRIADHSDVRLIVDTQRVVAHNYDEPLGEDAIPTGKDALSWLGVPLVSQGHVVGMVTLNHHQKHMYDSKDDQNIAFAFASQVAIALSNAELFEQTFDRTNELGTVLEAAQATSLTRDLDEVLNIVVELLLGALEMDQCTIMIWDDVDDLLEVQIDRVVGEDEARVRPRGMTFDLANYPGKRHALTSREVVVVTHEDQDSPFKSEIEELVTNNDAARLLVPLVVSEASIGLIQLEQHAVDDRQMTQQKVRLATALGSQAAIAIQNARLTNEMESMISESLVINELSQALGSTFEMEDMIDIVRNRVPQVTGSEEIYLALYDEENKEISFPMAVRNGQDFEIPARKLGNDEVSFVIKHNRFLTIGADYFSPEELRKSLGIENGEGDYKSYIGVPLSAENRVNGVLALVDTKRKSAFTMNDRRILEIVATQLGAVIQNARLFQRLEDLAADLERQVEDRTLELEDERDRIDTLYQITSELSRTLDMSRLQQRALGMMVKAIGADDGVILGLDPLMDTLFPQAALNPNNLIDNDDGTHGHLATSIGEWLIEQVDVTDIVIDDLSNYEHYDTSLPGADTYKSAIAVVLESNQNDPQGVLVLLSQQEAAFGEQEQRLLIAAATQIATATNNADLYNLIRDQAERLTNMLRTEQEEAEKNSAILESIADGVILTDADGVIIQFNSASERILQVPREQAIGQALNKFTGIYGTDIGAWTNIIQQQSADGDLQDHEPELLLNEQISLGDKIVNVQVSPVYTGGRFLGMVSVFRDITRDVEIDRLKGEFVSNVSHELRTPLTPIKGFTEMLLMGAAGPVNENQTRTLQMIKENVDRLTILVEDVLDISKIDSGKDKLNIEKLNLKVLLENVIDKQKLRHKQRLLDVSVDIAEDLPEIEGDVSKLGRIMANIIDNAFNYTRDGGSIAIKANLRPGDPGRVLLSVKDSGVGIMEEFRDNIWLRFQRYEEHVLQLDVAGTGLGLSIVKEMVEMHNGNVWFDSEPGVGTTFFVELPVEQSRFTSARATQTQTLRAISPED